jgi:chlorite dismutase
VDVAEADELLADFAAADPANQVFAFAVVGQRADVGVMLIAPDVAALQRTHARLLATPLGLRLEAVAELSFVSLTEAGEYGDSDDDLRTRLAAEGRNGDDLEAAVAASRRRLDAMAGSRLHPRLPRRRAICFYPMAKRRDGHANWYALPYEQRKAMMREHGMTGRTFADRITQLVTTSTGLSDWEWGVTLLSDDIKAINDVVYTMRFDEVSARYSLFGFFVVGLVQDTLGQAVAAAGAVVR